MKHEEEVKTIIKKLRKSGFKVKDDAIESVLSRDVSYLHVKLDKQEATLVFVLDVSPGEVLADWSAPYGPIWTELETISYEVEQEYASM